MEFTDLINKRKSIRGYLAKTVEKEKLQKIYHRELDLPDNEKPLVFIPLGYHNDQGREKTRKPLTELTKYL